MRKLIVAGALAVVTIGVGGTAFAGEGTGSGKGGPAGDGHPGGITRANSICTFSGLEDGEENPEGPSGPGTAQSWGQIPKEFRDFLTSVGSNPGISCNGHLNPWQEVVGGGEHG
jgi:hypothetical protein